MGSWHILIAWWLSAATASAPVPWAAPVAAPAAASDAAPAPDVREIGLSESVEITGRLGASRRSPASPAATTLEGDDLRRRGARSLPEGLASDPSVQAVDQVGNGRQLSIDLRGFSGAEGATALVVDGIRVNDADTNGAAWESVRPEEVERIEIVPGPSGATIGGGSLAGVVNVVRRAPSDALVADARLRGGSFGFRDASAFASGPAGSWRLLASAGAFADDGFRDDAGSDEQSFRLAAERDAGRATLGFDWSRVQGTWRQPGALKSAQIDEDPSQAPYNALDAQSSRQDLLAARLRRDGAASRLVAVLGYRDKSSDILTTGVSCYGYRTTDSQQSLSLTVEAENDLIERKGSRLSLRWGAEAARERLHPEGWATDDTCDGEIHDQALSSATDLDWDRGALFAGLQATLRKGLGLELSLRHDASRVSRTGGEVSGGGTWTEVSGDRSFGDSTLRLGIGRSSKAGPWTVAWRAAWEQSFLAPSAIQLFAYPGFYSNPDLSPQRGSGPSAGVSLTRRRLGVSVDVYETRVSDEVAYDEEDRQNVNAGTTRRRGMELRADWTPNERVRVSAGLALIDATYRSGFAEGTRVVAGAKVPLVARDRAAFGLALGPWRGFSADLVAWRCGSAALSNDFDGSSPELAPRRRLDVTLRQDVRRIRGLSLELAATNLLDDRHPTRGIESWGELYYTPPAPRAVTFGVAWRLP